LSHEARKKNKLLCYLTSHIFLLRIPIPIRHLDICIGTFILRYCTKVRVRWFSGMVQAWEKVVQGLFHRQLGQSYQMENLQRPFLGNQFRCL